MTTLSRDTALDETAMHEAGHAVVAAALHSTPDLAVVFPAGVTALDRLPYEQAVADLRGVPRESVTFPRTEVGKVSWLIGPDLWLESLLQSGTAPRDALMSAARKITLINLAGAEGQRVFLREVGEAGEPTGCQADLADATQALGDTFRALGMDAASADLAVHLEMVTLRRATRGLINWLDEPLGLVASELVARSPRPMAGRDVDVIVNRWKGALGESEARKGARLIESTLTG